MDFAVIVVIISFFSVLKFFKKHPVRYFFMYFNLLWFVFYFPPLWARVTLCVVIFAISISDIINSLKGEFKSSRTLHISLNILFVSFAFFLLDETRLLCSPESWIQGHSLWHIGTALSIYYYGKWRFLEREPFKEGLDK
jgi:hypothetical protein